MSKNAKKRTLKSSPWLLSVEQADMLAATRTVDFRKPVDILDIDGNTPLIRAAFHGNCQTMRFLLGRGANPNSANNIAWSALHFAGRENRYDAAELLIFSGAPVELRDTNGNTSLWDAVFDPAMQTVDVPVCQGASLDTPNIEVAGDGRSADISGELVEEMNFGGRSMQSTSQQSATLALLRGQLRYTRVSARVSGGQ